MRIASMIAEMVASLERSRRRNASCQSPAVFVGWERVPTGRSATAAVPMTDGSATTDVALQGDRGWQTDYLPVSFPGTGKIAGRAEQAAQASPATPYDPITRLSGGRAADR